MTRAASHETFDAVVDLGRDRRDPDWAYTVVKRSYRIDGARLTSLAPRPLLNDPREGIDEFPAECDFWPRKPLTDVTVEGRACLPGKTLFVEHEVRLEVGSFVRRIHVFGDRQVLWRSGKPYVGAIDAVAEVPLTPAFAYGGVDLRVPLARSYPTEVALVVAAVLHPGRYPRNPFGTGWLCREGRVGDVAMPNLEDPDDLLTDERLIANAAKWWLQPRPAYLSWQSPLMAPRLVHFGAIADEMPGSLDDLPAAERALFDAPSLEPGYVNADRAYQEAAPELSLPPIQPGTPVAVHGATASRSCLSFEVPPAPNVRIALGGSDEAAPVRMTHLRLRPDEAEVDFVYAAVRVALPKRYVRGIHPNIPLSATVDGEAVSYATPPTWDRAADPYSKGTDP